MAAATRPSQAVVLLLIVLLASARAATSLDGRWQDASTEDSGGFNDIDSGTLDVVWEVVPVKHSRDPEFGGHATHPHRHSWCPGCTTLLYYPSSASWYGRSGRVVPLTLSGGCDTVTTEYSYLHDLLSSCQGKITIPDNLVVRNVYMTLKGPRGTEFFVNRPFRGFNCSLPLYPSNIPGSSRPFPPQTYVPSSFAALFDDGRYLPLAGSALPPNPARFTQLGLRTRAYPAASSPLRFLHILMAMDYDPPVQLPEGLDLTWRFLYGYCDFPSEVHVTP